MVLQINSLRLVRYTDVDYHQFVAQIRVVLRRLEAAAPLCVIIQSILRIHLHFVLWVRPAAASRE